MVVDDDPAIREVIQAVLESEGYEVQVARDGPTALSLAAVRRPAMVLCDMWMPGMNGSEVAAEMRRHHGAAPPLVVMTATGDARKWAWEMGAAGHLPKPFDIDGLLAIVERTMGPASAQRPGALEA